MHYQVYWLIQDLRFPVPVIENVYDTWSPVNHGHPLEDATIVRFYAPPSLERVRIGKQDGIQVRNFL